MSNAPEQLAVIRDVRFGIVDDHDHLTPKLAFTAHYIGGHTLVILDQDDSLAVISEAGVSDVSKLNGMHCAIRSEPASGGPRVTFSRLVDL